MCEPSPKTTIMVNHHQNNWLSRHPKIWCCLINFWIKFQKKNVSFFKILQPITKFHFWWSDRAGHSVQDVRRVSVRAPVQHCTIKLRSARTHTPALPIVQCCTLPICNGGHTAHTLHAHSHYPIIMWAIDDQIYNMRVAHHRKIRTPDTDQFFWWTRTKHTSLVIHHQKKFHTRHPIVMWAITKSTMRVTHHQK